MKKNLFVAFAFFLGFGLNAQDFDRSKMDSLFSLIEKHQEGMGSVSIFKDGKEVYHNSIGYVSIGDSLKADRETKYRIGSITKMFTAVLVMQLVEEGRLSLGTKLAEFFPKIPNAEKISIEHLLRHQSGLFNFTSDEAYLSYMESPKTKTELLEIFKSGSTLFEPGSISAYSNTNYVLLTFIIEEVTGKDYAKVLQKRIVKPLGLKNTYYGGEIEPQKNEALSYIAGNPWRLATETHMSIPQGAGAIVSTPTDLNKFLTALYTGKLVEDHTLKKMMEIEKGFGIGMFQIPFYGMTAFGHNGGIDGFQTTAGYFPKKKVSMTYFSNGANMAVNDIALGVLSIYFGKEYELPEFLPEYKVVPEALEQYAGIYGSETFPLKITISVEGNTLMAQATGQAEFGLEAYAKDKFKFDPAGLTMEFFPKEDKMLFKQSGMSFELKRGK